jgi:hydrogenase expression/formation protein HypE
MSSEHEDLLNLEGWSCPIPLRDYPNVIMGHGGGGRLSAELIEHLFLPAFSDGEPPTLTDSAVLTVEAGRLAFSTDSFVVQPLLFPGGSIGELAINGTINDLAMCGAQPYYMSCSFIIEEGMPIYQLGAIAERMGRAARQAGVRLVTGDTKVVDHGHGDGVYINTSGIGVIPENVQFSPSKARPGDIVIVSGTLGDHGMAIMSVREGLEFETVIKSDSAALHELVAAMLAATGNIRVMRDPTRGGLASSLNEIVQAAHVGIVLNERDIPVNPAVAAACEMLGMDPIYVANEGKLIAIVAPEDADAVLAVMQAHQYGKAARIIGKVVEKHPGILVAKTGIGGTRVVDMQIGEQLPRIC